MDTTTGTTIDVCVDCMLVHANGETSGTPDREPLGLIPDRAELSMGCLECEPCGHSDCGHAGPVCGCGWGDYGHGFSWSACQGCGSLLGGDRYPLVVWY